MGSLHPVLFFAGLYVVALLFSIFICSSLFYSCNSNSAQSIGDTEPVKEMTSPAAGQVASR
jgi:hypothetical protein